MRAKMVGCDRSVWIVQKHEQVTLNLSWGSLMAPIAGTEGVWGEVVLSGILGFQNFDQYVGKRCDGADGGREGS